MSLYFLVAWSLRVEAEIAIRSQMEVGCVRKSDHLYRGNFTAICSCRGSPNREQARTGRANTGWDSVSLARPGSYNNYNR